MKKDIIKNNIKEILALSAFTILSATVVFSVAFFCAGDSCFNSGIASAYTHTSQYETIPQGTSMVSYKIYDLSGGYFMVPEKGTSKQSQKFEGYTIYDYYYPSNPELNNDDRPKKFQFKQDGSLETSGNLAINGPRTMLINSHDNARIGFGSEKKSWNRVDYRRFIEMRPGSFDVKINGNAIINNSWDKNNETGVGPSVFFNANHSKFEINDFDKVDEKPYGKYFLSDNRKSKIVETNFVSPDLLWLEYLDDGSKEFQLQDAQALFRKEPYFYIADSGNRRIVRYSADPLEFVSLGRADWNWWLQGITVDNEDYIYVTDSSQNTIIKTKIDGSGWQTSYDNMDYASRVFFSGSEEFNIGNTEGSFADDAKMQDCGYTKHEAMATSSTGALSYDAVAKKIRMQDSEHPLFGEYSLYFNGQESLQMPDHSGWNFQDDYFTIDFWVNFASTETTQALVSVPDNFLLQWHHPDSPNATPSLQFGINYEASLASGERKYVVYEQPWEPEPGEWYHITIMRTEDDALRMMVDGVPLGLDIPLNNAFLDGHSSLTIGTYVTSQGSRVKHFRGNMDNFRITKGQALWNTDFSFNYEFFDPHGIIIVGDWLYIADSGNNRIVKMRKDFKEWYTMGLYEGSGKYQFNNPTDIYYSDGYFYIVDSGNNRVIKSDLAQMQYMFKGDMSGSSWETVYSGPGRLQAVAVRGEDVMITDTYNNQVIINGERQGGKNPWYAYLKFTFPIDILPAPENNWYVLDAISDIDFAVHANSRAAENYGTSQEEGIRVRFNGGLIARPNLFTGGVIALLNGEDYNRWVTDGHKVSHCPEIPEHEPAVDFGGSCDAWSIHTEGFDYGYTYRSTNVDCNMAAGAGVVPPSECIGQWDWNVYWPVCHNLKPAFSRYTADSAAVAGHCCTGSGCCKGSGDPDCFEHSTCVGEITVCEAWCEQVPNDCFVGWSVNHVPFDSTDVFGREVFQERGKIGDKL